MLILTLITYKFIITIYKMLHNFFYQLEYFNNILDIYGSKYGGYGHLSNFDILDIFTKFFELFY